MKKKFYIPSLVNKVGVGGGGGGGGKSRTITGLMRGFLENYLGNGKLSARLSMLKRTGRNITPIFQTIYFVDIYTFFYSF